MPTVLLIDDDPDVTTAVSTRFERDGYRVVHARSGEEGAQAIARDRPDLVVVAARLPDESAGDLLARVRDLSPVAVVLASEGDEELAVEAMRQGAEGFVAKPVRARHLEAAVERGLEKARLRQLVRRLAERRAVPIGTFFGNSPQMQEVADQIQMLATNDRLTVLLVGESGTGKGRLARAIHALSPRRDGPFVETSCAGVAPTALDLELFGQEAGSGDDGGRPGLVEAAHQGTLFLDEMGQLDPALQPKLLRVLEGKGARRTGGIRDVRVDVRLVAATTRDLVQEVTEGRLREDLYYRLSVMPVHLPPLRAWSRDDLRQLIERIQDELRSAVPAAPAVVDPGALDCLSRYAWPGNVRELRNVLERAMILARGEPLVRERHLPAEVRDMGVTGAEEHVPRTLEEVERVHIGRTLRAHEGNRTRAARELGISRATLIKKIREYGLREHT